MTRQYDDSDIDYEIPEEPKGKRRVPFVIIAAAMAMIGVASAFAWRAYTVSSYQEVSATTINTVGLDEFRGFQQQVVGQLQANAQALAALQAEVKRLSDQVAALSAKMDAIQSPISSAQAAIPAAPPKPKKAAAAKPKTGISTGGDPLPPPVQLTR